MAGTCRSASNLISPRWRSIPLNRRHLLAVGGAHAAYADDLGSGIWKAYWDLNLNAAAFVGPGEAIAVGPQGKIVRFTLP